MKKVNLNGKLSLKKETIAKLNNEQMNFVKGGDIKTAGACASSACEVTYLCVGTVARTCPQTCLATGCAC